MNLAQTILQQIKMGGTMKMMSWGFRSPKAFGEGVFGNNYGGLFFQVSGFKHKGKVMVKLDYNDTYTVEIGTLRKGVWKCKKAVSGVYCDMLTDVIDGMVETDNDQSEEYKNKVNKEYSWV